MPKNVIFIVADAMRSDRLSCTGYRRKGRKTTPNIDELAEDGALFPNAYSPGPWTGASQPPLLTGMHASNLGFAGGDIELEEDTKTVGNFFQQEGFETRSYNMSLQIREELGFSRGFNYYEDVAKKDKIEIEPWYIEGAIWNVLFGKDDRTRYTLKKINRWLEARDDRPFFLFWNPTNPHNKYSAPRKWRRRFEVEVSPDMDEDAIDDVSGWGDGINYITGEVDLTEEEMDVVESRYDAEIAYLDHRVGQLVEELKEQGIYDDTIIVFTSDHGDNFGSYERLIYHNFRLNEGLVKVPLVIKGEEFEETGKPVTTLDIVNSALKAATGTEAESIESQPSLLGGEQDREIVFSERARVSESKAGKLEEEKLPREKEWYVKGLKTAIKNSYKLIKDENGEAEAFRLEGDEQQKHDIPEDEKEELEAAIDSQLGGYRPGKTVEVDEKVKDKLEKLGYN